MQEPDLHGKTALVTGGGRGIGAAVARLLARTGARVVVTARTESEIAAVAQDICDRGGEARAIRADIGRIDEVRHLVDEAGSIDILINNAGIIQPIGSVATVDPQSWLHNVEVNLGGVFLPTHYSLPGMIERGWGRIVNVTTGAARGSQPNWSAYSAAKGGVEVLTKVLAREVGEQGIRVNAVRPGIVNTEMQAEIRATPAERFGKEHLQRFRGYEERGLLRSPEDPALLILWLLSPEADDVNGEVLAIDEPAVAAKVGLVPMGR